MLFSLGVSGGVHSTLQCYSLQILDSAWFYPALSILRHFNYLFLPSKFLKDSDTTFTNYFLLWFNNNIILDEWWSETPYQNKLICVELCHFVVVSTNDLVVSTTSRSPTSIAFLLLSDFLDIGLALALITPHTHHGSIFPISLQLFSLAIFRRQHSLWCHHLWWASLHCALFNLDSFDTVSLHDT